MEEEKFYSGRGGKREGAGRPKKDPTVIYFRRVKPEWGEELDKKLEELKGQKNEKDD